MYDKLDQLDDDAIFIPNDEEEEVLSDCFHLSLSRSMEGPYCDYIIVKDFAQKYDTDSIELMRIMKMMILELT